MGGWVLWPMDHPGSLHLLLITFLWPPSQALWKDPPRFISVVAQKGTRPPGGWAPLQAGRWGSGPGWELEPQAWANPPVLTQVFPEEPGQHRISVGNEICLLLFLVLCGRNIQRQP